MAIKDYRDKLKEKLNKKKITGFLKKQGLYIGMIAGVIAIGLTAFFATNQAGRPQEEDEGDANENLPAQVIEAPSLDEEIADLEDSPQQSETPEKEDSEVIAPPVKPAPKTVLAMPVDGEIITGFFGDKLVYNQTLNQWATHNGIDIAAAEGAEVKAALSGTVEEAYEDKMYGGVVVIGHSNDEKTVYKCIRVDEGLEAGNKVNKGDTIGKLTKASMFEAHLKIHLHFEYLKGNEYVDPEKYLD